MTTMMAVAEEPTIAPLHAETLQQEVSQSLAQSLGQLALEHRLTLKADTKLEKPVLLARRDQKREAEAE
ncbi:hypothetical protein [Gallaecimonas sp. GXIMD4217]|uniref:hypothetical protein n=1 Tax=Gallaecimonas sp. GXIMD4217 TaxID=3131927 RepID=UPI00311B13EF